MEPRASVPVLSFCRPWQNYTYEFENSEYAVVVFKLNSVWTTAVRGGSEFCRPWQNETCEFKNFPIIKRARHGATASKLTIGIA
ncbi:hypothetical protein TPHV1_30214 [Treponema phagedenis]|uniref:Uncharacterized protein n=1 Tax=Treponema phagedenis TaxID=162 RepID=A0A0B7GUG9_TREPH|nr:hypothetical protein TPHV1_30214 [Treponema phagedenis]